MTLSFQAAGSLWRDCLVLEDIQTKSLWSQVSGECISGPMKSKSLSLFPSALTTYEEFKRQYPHGKLLAKAGKGSGASAWESYFADSTALGLFGRVDNFEQPKGKDIVFGVRLGGKQVAITQDYLSKKQFALLEQFSPPVLVTYNPATSSAAAFSLPAQHADYSDLVLIDNKITLGSGQIAWNARTGRLLSGVGDNLALEPITPAFWFVWVTFFPNTELLK